MADIRLSHLALHARRARIIIPSSPCDPVPLGLLAGQCYNDFEDGAAVRAAFQMGGSAYSGNFEESGTLVVIGGRPYYQVVDPGSGSLWDVYCGMFNSPTRYNNLWFRVRHMWSDNFDIQGPDPFGNSARINFIGGSAGSAGTFTGISGGFWAAPYPSGKLQWSVSLQGPFPSPIIYENYEDLANFNDFADGVTEYTSIVHIEDQGTQVLYEGWWGPTGGAPLFTRSETHVRTKGTQPGMDGADGGMDYLDGGGPAGAWAAIGPSWQLVDGSVNNAPFNTSTL